jgi:glycerophosphoryl diester phosphodiesterase
MTTTPIAIAHRGDPVAERENTLAAFAAAVQKGADMVELDLRRTRDGEVVVLHDARLTRLWAVDQAVADLDLTELKEIGEGTMRVPTLGEVLDAIDLPLMVDFTGGEVVEGAVRKVREAGAIGRSLFVTGNVGALRVLRALAPEARIGLTWTKPKAPPLSLLRELRAEFWNPAFGLITPERVDAMHAHGLKVSTWTVDQLSDMANVTRAGVDAVVSNRIGDLRRFLSPH